MFVAVVESRATFVICPASLIHQWEKEIERKVKPHKLKILMYHGTNREKDVKKYVITYVSRRNERDLT